MRDHTGGVITDFPCPPGSPSAVAESFARYREAVARLEAARSEAAAAEEAAEQAAQDDIAAIVAEANEGRELADPNEREREARQALATARKLLAAAEQLADERGNAVGAAIEEEREAWQASLGERLAAAEGAYAASLEQLRAAAADLAEGREVARWLAAFQGWKLTPGKAPVGYTRTMYWNGAAARLRVPTAGIPGAEVYGDNVEAAALIAALGSGASAT